MRYALEKHRFFRLMLALVFVTLLAVATGGCPLLGDNYVCRIAKQFETYSLKGGANLFTKIFCPNDAHTSPARAYATIVPRCIKDNFEYETEVIWSISRTGDPMKANDKPKIDATNLAEFYGDAGVGTAEDISFLKARPQ